MNNLSISTTVLSVSSFSFKGDDGLQKTMYRVYIELPSGDVGSICAFNSYRRGDPVTLELGVTQGKLKLRLVDPMGYSAPVPISDDDDEPSFSAVRSPSLATGFYPHPASPPPPSDLPPPSDKDAPASIKKK